MKRFFDLILTFILLFVLILPMLFISIMIRTSSKGPVLHWSDRIGKDNAIFRMPKFRTMNENTPQIATHLLENPESFISPIGSFLRKSSLDELPQLFSILKGEMSFVGPRPALFNQDDLISLRKKYKVDILTPGLTGWAQINGRDDLTILEKVKLDVEYLNNRSFYFDLKIMVDTIFIAVRSDGIRH
jgi:O-antigen biosynthesis protein WbqP